MQEERVTLFEKGDYADLNIVVSNLSTSDDMDFLHSS